MIQRWRQLFCRLKEPSIPVISVGNLTVGGTGKTPFCQFLLRRLQQMHYHPALAMRGYKSLWVKKNKSKSLVVSRGKNVLTDAACCGDEAFEVACSVQAPVVIGKNRLYSYKLLKQELEKSADMPVSCLVLDDGYQQMAIRKDFDILLLDARKPFDNGHCLPAGKLRERNVSRAHLIVLTHADRVSSENRDSVITELAQRLPYTPIITGRHALEGLFAQNSGVDCRKQLINGRCLLVAGIGSFDQFVVSMASVGVAPERAMQFPDHHAYTVNDLVCIKQAWEFFEDCICIVTTAKDWGKIQPLLACFDVRFIQHWYVARIQFEFMTVQEQGIFDNVLSKVLLPAKEL